MISLLDIPDCDIDTHGPLIHDDVEGMAVNHLINANVLIALEQADLHLFSKLKFKKIEGRSLSTLRGLENKKLGILNNNLDFNLLMDIPV